MHVTLDIPEGYFMGKNESEVGGVLKLYAALALFQAGKLSAGAATELAGIDRYTFMAECKKHNIPTINYSSDDLDAELMDMIRQPSSELLGDYHFNKEESNAS